MSNLMFKVCPKCGRLKPVGNGARHCAECAEKAKAQRVRKRDYQKEYARRLDSDDPKYKRFYKSKEWQATSRQYSVEAGHRCEECGRPGTDVHHVVPIQTDEGWPLRFDFDNLKLLCVKCHNLAHMRDFGHRRD